jgi:hypothetical protein
MNPPGVSMSIQFPFYPQQQVQQRDFAVVPCRVDQALQVLNLFAQKEADRPSGEGVGCEIIEGKKLTDEERIVRVSACELLSKYFQGKLRHDKWDELRFDLIDPASDTNDEKKQPGTLMHCICKGVNPMTGISSHRLPVNDCVFCHGGGFVYVIPAHGPQE